MLRFFAYALLIAATAGCSSSEGIDINNPQVAEDHSLHDAIIAAARKARPSGPSPAAYRKLALEIESLRPRLDAELTDLSERKLVFLAVPSLLQIADLPPAEQAEKLALTVWPTALRVPPEPKETAAHYLERACAGPLALDCKYVVPEYRPLVVSALVWTRLQERAREAVSDCRRCQDDPSFEQVLEQIDGFQTKIAAKVALLGDAVHPKSWPHAGEFSRPWSDPAVLSVGEDGAVTFAGEVVSSGAWQRRIKTARKDSTVLGVHLLPSADVQRLMTIADGAREAGYLAIALETRTPQYPFSLREYRITTARGKHAIGVAVRGQDTVQVLVQAFDAAIESAATDPKVALLHL